MEGGRARRRGIISIENIPRQIILDIFSRLPIRSLSRIGCVCKEWYYLTRDPWLHRMRLACPSKEEEAMFQISSKDSVSYETDLAIMTENYTIPKRLLRLPVDCRVLHSFHGLVCSVQHTRHPESGMPGSYVFVSNPLTGEVITLPLFPAVRLLNNTWFGLGFDFCINKYKVVAVNFVELDIDNGRYCLTADVYTIETSSSSWRKIKSKPTVPFDECEESVFVSGARHWMVSDGYNRNDRKTMVISFDFEREEFKTLPRAEAFSLRAFYNLVDLKGCLGVVDFSVEGCTIWKLIDYERNHWVRYCKIQIPNLIRVVGLIGEDKMILLVEDPFTCATRRVELSAYNSKTTTLRNICSLPCACGFLRRLILHRGSLVSPLP